MSRLVLAAFAVVTLSVPLAAQDKALIEKGMKLYDQQKCSLCHAIAGKGSARGPLDGVGSKLTAEEIREWLVNPKAMAEKMKATRQPMMKSYSTIDKADIDALVAYMLSLKK